MNKIIITLLVLILCSSCNKTGKNYYFEYKIYYPEHTVKKRVYSSNKPSLYSSRGTNSITWTDTLGNYVKESTTAPIEIIGIKELKTVKIIE